MKNKYKNILYSSKKVKLLLMKKKDRLLTKRCQRWQNYWDYIPQLYNGKSYSINCQRWQNYWGYIPLVYYGKNYSINCLDCWWWIDKYYGFINDFKEI